MNDEDNVTGGDLAKAITFEVAANTLLDKYTAGLLAAPDPSLVSKGIYALANVGGSAAINYFAQRLRGGKFNLGELLTAGGLSLVPGGVQAKTLSGRVVKGATKGAGLGALQVTGESLINEGKPPELQDLALGTTFGGGLGGALSGVSGPEAAAFIKGLKKRIGQSNRDRVRRQIFEGAQRGKPQGSQLELVLQEQEGVEDLSKYGFGPEGPAGGATDDQIMQAYRERTGELDLDPSRRIVGEPISTATGFTKKANEFNDYVEKAYQYRLNRLQERKANLMKGFDEIIQNDSGQDVILVKRSKLKNRQDPASKENYIPKLKFDVERDIIARSGYEVKQDEDVKYLQLIRRELNKIEQQNPKLYLTNLMEYGDAAYLEHKIARRQAGQFWDRVEGQREDDIANGLFQWTGATKRNSLKNLRLLFDPNYKTLKDRIEDRLLKLEKPLKEGGLALKSNGEPEGFIITIEDPNEAVYSAKDLFVRSNPGNIQIRKAGTGEVVGIIPDFYRQMYSTQFTKAFNAHKLALTGADVPKNLRAQGQERIDAYRNSVLDRMLKDIVTGKVSMLGREQAYLDELGEFYNLFARLEDSTGAQWVRKPRWVSDILRTKEFDIPESEDITFRPETDLSEDELRRLQDARDLLEQSQENKRVYESQFSAKGKTKPKTAITDKDYRKILRNIEKYKKEIQDILTPQQDLFDNQ